jgi:histone H3/H4
MLFDIFFQAASVFVLYATSSANSVAQKSNRKTITGPDVVRSLFFV